MYSIKEGHKASIYMNVPVRLNAISSYQSQQSSPAIRDITVAGHTRHLCLRPYKTSPSPTVRDISASGCTRHLRLRLYKTSPSPAETCICNINNKYLHSRTPSTFEELATFYLSHIKQVQPQGPYNLLGGSFGGVLCLEISLQ